MKAKLIAGAELDLLTKGEVTDVVGQAIAASRYGIQLKPILQLQTDPNTIYQMTIIIPDGWMWDIRSLYASKSTADVIRVYRDNVTPGAKQCSIVDDTDNGNFQTFTKGSFVMRGGQQVVVQCKTQTTTLTSVRLSVMEVPNGHDWHLK